jgi:hypothetical protein
MLAARDARQPARRATRRGCCSPFPTYAVRRRRSSPWCRSGRTAAPVAAARRPVGRLAVEPLGALTLFLVLRAFASGRHGAHRRRGDLQRRAAFRYPQSRNAATTLGIMGALAVTMFLGISYLARATGVVPTRAWSARWSPRSPLAVFGDGPLLPGPGRHRGDPVPGREHGVRGLPPPGVDPRAGPVPARQLLEPRRPAGVQQRHPVARRLRGRAAAGLPGRRHRARELYVIGVFTAFTLSQAGMVRHHLPRARTGLARGRGAERGRRDRHRRSCSSIAAVAKFLGRRLGDPPRDTAADAVDAARPRHYR